ncbi:hypothetical protein LJC35_00225 [Parabacteroides sp. OttesenSCG-928-N08]|nr:hypothetical protein [Parabacteroides sp. OttesenSCG-928-N08]
MTNKEKIDFLLLDIRELEKMVAAMRTAELFPVSFFSQSFDLTHKVMTTLHALETEQIESLRRQMEEHQQLIKAMPLSRTTPLSAVYETMRREENEVMQEMEEEGFDIEPDPVQVPLPEEKETINPPIEEEIEEEEVFVESIQLDSPLPSAFPAVEKLVDSEKKAPVFLSELLEKQNLSDFRKAFSLNDRFRFRRELFDNNETKMNSVVAELNDLSTLEESLSYIREKLHWDLEQEAAADFIKLLEKRFL